MSVEQLRRNAKKPSHRRKLLAAVRNRVKTPEGILNRYGSAARANTTHQTIYNWYKSGRLSAVSTKPLRFSDKAVDDAASKYLPVGPDDLPIVEIAAHVPKDNLPTKLLQFKAITSRIRCVISHLGIACYKRKGIRRDGNRGPLACISRNQLPYIIARVVGESMPNGHISLRQAARTHKRDRDTLIMLLEKFAPGAVREATWFSERGNLITGRVAPTDAIEAALRGEHWAPQSPPMPAAARTSAPPANCHADAAKVTTGAEVATDPQEWSPTKYQLKILNAVRDYKKAHPERTLTFRDLACQMDKEPNNNHLWKNTKVLQKHGWLTASGPGRASAGYGLGPESKKDASHNP